MTLTARVRGYLLPVASCFFPRKNGEAAPPRFAVAFVTAVEFPVTAVPSYMLLDELVDDGYVDLNRGGADLDWCGSGLCGGHAGPALAEHVIQNSIGWFNKAANGEMEIELYTADQLVPQGELFRAVQSGTIDAAQSDDDSAAAPVDVKVFGA